MRALIVAGVSLGLAVAGVACGKSTINPKVAHTPVTQAYTLLDKGQTESAIELLEQTLHNDPTNGEARLLLASAYMGSAGIDVLSLHDAFADVLFSKSISQTFLSGSKGASGVDPLGGPRLPDAHTENGNTEVENLFEDIDEFLNNVRRVTAIFDRFPHVPEHKWPLMEQSLMNLDQLPAEKEVRVYRMFIRLIYLKEILITRVIHDASFGTREWACKLDLQNLNESLLWISTTLAQVSDDFVHLYPKLASPFDRVQVMIKAFEGKLGNLEAGAPSGSHTANLLAQSRLRGALRCGDLVP